MHLMGMFSGVPINPGVKIVNDLQNDYHLWHKCSQSINEREAAVIWTGNGRYLRCVIVPVTIMETCDNSVLRLLFINPVAP